MNNDKYLKKRVCFLFSASKDISYHHAFYFRYKKSFEIQPSDYSGCNLAILLVAAGHCFSQSDELQRVCKFK